MLKMKNLLLDHFDLTKKFIADKNAKLAMVYKFQQRLEQKQKDMEER